MPRVCPRPCSRLAAAAVFISVGVVQFVAGIILLRSEFVYLLAGPDFWTSSCNIAVGCLLGLTASVWKRSKKRESKKHLLRSHLLVALMLSALILNGTTLGILLLGKGNTLLTIHLERHSRSTLGSEVLAYAYVTSICCPIVCIVVSIVSVSGSCFKYAYRNKSVNTKTPVNCVKKGQPRSLGWIYTPELLELSKKKLRELVLSSSSDFSDDDDRDVPTYQKCPDSSYDVQLVLNHMAHGKRDSILSDSAIMLRQMDLRRKKLAALNQDGSYLGPSLFRVREPGIDESKRPRDHAIQYDDSLHRSEKSRRDYSNTRLVELAAKDSKSKSLSTLYKNPYASEELLNEYQSTASKLVKHNPSQYKKFRERLRTGSEIAGASSSCISGVTDYGIENSSKESMEVDETDFVKKSGEYLRQMSNPELSSLEKFKLPRETERYGRFELVKDTPPGLVDCFSPDELDAGEESTFDFSRTSSWASEIVPISLKHSSVARLSDKLIPVASPVVPALPKKTQPTASDDSGINAMESHSFSDVTEQNDLKNGRGSLSSFRDDSGLGNEEETQRCLKIVPQSVKKYDLNKMAKMASISEESNLELNRPEEKSDGLVRSKKTRSHYRKQSSSSSHSGTSKRSNPDTSTVPRRKSTLKKMWSSALSENQTDFLSQVVDKDSLIGLSEEELIERQFRNRSIRKVIQQRIKEKDGSLVNT